MCCEGTAWTKFLPYPRVMVDASAYVSSNIPEKEGGTPPLTSDVLIEKLHQFLTSCTDRTATSQELLTEFSPHLTATNARDVFRSMLRRLCDFSRTISKEGVWKLKENYN